MPREKPILTFFFFFPLGLGRRSGSLYPGGKNLAHSSCPSTASALTYSGPRANNEGGGVPGGIDAGSAITGSAAPTAIARTIVSPLEDDRLIGR